MENIIIDNLIKVERRGERDCLILAIFCLVSAVTLLVVIFFIPFAMVEKDGENVDSPWKPYLGIAISGFVTVIGLPKPGLEVWKHRKRIQEYMMLKQIRMELQKVNNDVSYEEIVETIKKLTWNRL